MINAVMESSTINGAILSQTVEQNQQLQQKADQYGISLGKARLIDQLISKNPSLTFDSLAGRTVNELNLLASNENIQLSTVNSIGSASDSAYIGSEAAVSAALSHAGICFLHLAILFLPLVDESPLSRSDGIYMETATWLK